MPKLGLRVRLQGSLGWVMVVVLSAGCGERDARASEVTPGVQSTTPGARAEAGAPGRPGAAPVSGSSTATATAAASGQPAGARTPAAAVSGGAGGVSGQLGSAGASGVSPPAPNESASSALNEWRMMGYDAKNWYFNPAEGTLSAQNASQLAERWRFTVSGLPIGTPVIAAGKVFALSSAALYAIDLESGAQLWSRNDIVGSAAVAYDDGFVYVHESAIPPHVYKLKASDGTTVWKSVPNCQDDKSCSGESVGSPGTELEFAL